MKRTVTINKIKDQSELYCRYPGQTSAQGCYIELDCARGVLSASYNAEIGNAVPFSVWHGHDQRFGIPCLTPDAANDLMAEILPLAERVVAGYESVWDGNNHVARYDDDATEAIEEISALCHAVEADETNSVQEWDAGDWLSGVQSFRDAGGEPCGWDDLASVEWSCEYPPIKHDTTDAELDDLIATIKNDNDEVVLVGLEKWVYELRDQCRANHPDE